MIRKEWDKHETALLIEVYLNVKYHEKNLNEELEFLSLVLRTMALKSGLTIDEQYRNVNGMRWQYSYLKGIFENNAETLKKTPKIFVDIVDIYKNDKDSFYILLNEAKNMINTNNRQLFIDWLSNDKIKSCTTDEVANLISKIFIKFLNIDVWGISNSKVYSDYRNRLIEDRNFRDYDRKTYKIFFLVSKYYLSFLENMCFVGNEKNNRLSDKEKMIIFDFFKNEEISSKFYILYSYAVKMNANLMLDVRTSIIGVKLDGERLRFYCSKDGTLRFAKNILNFTATNILSVNLEHCFGIIDKVEEFFYKNKQIVSLEKKALGYSYHFDFGFGKVLSKTNTFYNILFDNDFNQNISMSDPKNNIITDNQYKNKIAPNTFRTKIALKDKEPSFVLSLDETDFYDYVKESYFEKHKNDGKAKKSAFHARKCIELLRKLSEVLKMKNLFEKNIFSIKTKTECLLIFKKIKMLENQLDKEDYKWYLYSINRYISFIDSNSVKNPEKVSNINKILDINNDYLVVLEKEFKDGFKYLNIIRKKQFITCYEKINNKKFTDSDEQYVKKLKSIAFECEGLLYLPSLISNDIRNVIINDIKKTLNTGASLIYYSTIYEKNIELLPTFSEEMLVSYLKFVYKNDFVFERKYLCYKNQNRTSKDDLIKLFVDERRILDIDYICSKLPHLTRAAINRVLEENDFILNIRNKSYFYKDIFIIEENELKLIIDFIGKSIMIDGQTDGTKLFNFVQKNIPDIIEINSGITNIGLRNILKNYLSNLFSFHGDVISELGSSLDAATLFRMFAERHERFSLDELDCYKKSINRMEIYYDSIFSVSIRINESTFVKKDLVNFDIEKIDNALSKYFVDDYISFTDIVNYHSFPTLEYPWNDYLLESYVYNFSRKFRLIHAGFNKNIPVGGIVKMNSKIDNFDSLLISVIKNNKIYERQKVFEYLQENRFIFTRKLKNIDLLINEAMK